MTSFKGTLRLMLQMTTISLALVAIVTACGTSAGNASPAPQAKAVRVAYFPNITHVQPLVGLRNGVFQKELGSVEIQSKVFNAGPSEIEALFAGEIDIGYTGPSPAVNGYIQSRGQALRVVAGAVGGGASLVVRSDSGINGPKDLAGKRVASPQLGNTQDIALRSYLLQNGLKPKEQGGSVEVIPISNPDILSLFLRKELDGAWVPEPWATRLAKEAGGRVFLDEKDLWPGGKFATTVVIVRKAFLDQQPELVRRWLKAHVEVTRWVNEHPQEARGIVQAEIARLTGAKLDDQTMAGAYSKLSVSYEPLTDTVRTAADRAFALGFLGSAKPNLDTLFDFVPLDQVLPDLKLSPVT